MASSNTNAAPVEKTLKTGISGIEKHQDEGFVQFDVFDDEEVYNMHERYEDNDGLNGHKKNWNRKGASGTGTGGKE